MLNKKEVEFLEDLEIRLAKQADAKTKNIKDKLLISNREFIKFWNIMEKIEKQYCSDRARQKEQMAQKRKNDPNYGREKWRKQYSKDKEMAKRLGIKFNKTMKDYKEEYERRKAC